MARRLLLDETPLLLLPSLAVVLGVNEALILQQFNYWLRSSDKEWEGYFWTFNSYKKWQTQFPFMSKETLARAIRHLEKMGLLVSKVGPNKKVFDRTKWYRIDYEKFEEMFPDERVILTPRMRQIDTTIVSECSDDSVKLTPQGEADHDVNMIPPIPKKITTKKSILEGASSLEKKPRAPKLHVRPIFAEMQKEFGFPERTNKDPIPSYGKEAKAIDRMLKRGYTEAEILESWRAKVAARGEFVSMTWVNEDIGKHTNRPKQGSFNLPDSERLAADARERGLVK